MYLIYLKLNCLLYHLFITFPAKLSLIFMIYKIIILAAAVYTM